MLIENGGVPEVLNSGAISSQQLNHESGATTNYLIIPLIVNSGIIGLIILFTEKIISEQPIIDLCKIHSNYFASLIHQHGLLREIENIKEVTEQKIALKTENIVRSTRELKHILDSVRAGIIIANQNDEVIVDINLATSKLIGEDKELIVGTQIKDHFYLSRDGSSSKNNFIGEEALLKTRSGKLIPVIKNREKITLQNAEYVILSFMDISERKQMEEALHKAHYELEQKVELRTKELSKANESLQKEIQERVKAEEELLKLYWAVEQSPNPIIITDLEGCIEYVNPSFSEVTGFKFEEAVGNTPRILKSGAVKEDVYRELWSNVVNGIQFRAELLNRKKNGELYWASISISPIRSVAGEITHYLGIQEDVTERKLFEQKVLEAKEKAEQSDRLKSNLMTNMSHEFRTPLIGILGFSQILGDIVEDEEILEMIKNIRLSGKRLLNTLNDVLHLAQLESNEIKLNLVKNDFVQLVKDSAKEFEEDAAAKNLTFKVTSLKDKVISNVDADMFKRSLRNIIDNAIKFTENGFVSIEVDAIKNNQSCLVEITVEDSGIGIPKDYHGIIFEAFRQASEGYNRNFEGSGLGLTISKKIVELLGGTINIKSQINIGSAFTIQLPLSCSGFTAPPDEITTVEKKAGRIKADREPGSKFNILVVEDNPANCDVMELFLKDQYDVDIANEGNEALEKIFLNHYDLILMDINLGAGMNGADVTKKIKEKPLYTNVPVIAVTGYAMFGDKEKFLSQGFNDYLAKPFDGKELLDMISKYL